MAGVRGPNIYLAPAASRHCLPSHRPLPHPHSPHLLQAPPPTGPRPYSPHPQGPKLCRHSPTTGACSLVHFLRWLPFLSAWRLSLQWKLSSQNSANQMLRLLLSSVRLEKYRSNPGREWGCQGLLPALHTHTHPGKQITGARKGKKHPLTWGPDKAKNKTKQTRHSFVPCKMKRAGLGPREHI